MCSPGPATKSVNEIPRNGPVSPNNKPAYVSIRNPDCEFERYGENNKGLGARGGEAGKEAVVVKDGQKNLREGKRSGAKKQGG